eukprot:COSAG02_NODE_59764_length_273_cov_0.649425_1_plen_26_part_10
MPAVYGGGSLVRCAVVPVSTTAAPSI